MIMKEAPFGVVKRRRRSVLDFVVGTILSQNTTDVNSGRAFSSLKAKYPTWEAVRTAKANNVADSIRCGGLADTKVIEKCPGNVWARPSSFTAAVRKLMNA